MGRDIHGKTFFEIVALREYLRNTSRNTTDAPAWPGEERKVDKFCDCNQGRRECTCKGGQLVERRQPLKISEIAVKLLGKVIEPVSLEKIKASSHYGAMAVEGLNSDLSRITAERNALQALLTKRDERTDRLIDLLKAWAENPPSTLDAYNQLRDKTDAEINAVCQFPQSCSSACGCKP